MAKRRANGEGTITKRADGRYHAAAYVYRPDGTRTRKFVYGKTRDEVADKLTEMQEKTRQGIPAASSTMAFGDYLTYWLAAIAPERLKPSTLNSYEGLTRLYIRANAQIARARGVPEQGLVLVAHLAGQAAQDRAVAVKIEQRQLGFDGELRPLALGRAGIERIGAF